MMMMMSKARMHDERRQLNGASYVRITPNHTPMNMINTTVSLQECDRKAFEPSNFKTVTQSFFILLSLCESATYTRPTLVIISIRVSYSNNIKTHGESSHQSVIERHHYHSSHFTFELDATIWCTV